MLAGAGCDTAATMPAPEGHGSRRWGARDPAQWPILRKSDCRPPPSSGSRFISAKHCRAAWSPSRRQHLQSSLCLSRTQSLKLSLDGLLLSLGTLLPSDLSTEVGGSSAEDDRARDAIRTCACVFFYYKEMRSPRPDAFAAHAPSCTRYDFLAHHNRSSS